MNKPAVERVKKIIKAHIVKGLWKPGQRIPSVSDTCKVLGVCRETAKKAREILKDQGILDDQGSSGVFVRPLSLQILYKENRQLFFAAMAEKHIDVTKYLMNDGQILDRYVIMTGENEVVALDLASGVKIKMTTKEIEDLIYEPISVEKLLSLKGPKLRTAKRKFNRQKEIRDAATVIYKNRESVNIQWSK